MEDDFTPFIVNIDDDASIYIEGILSKLVDKSIFNYPDTSYGRLTMMSEKYHPYSFLYHGLLNMINYAENENGWYKIRFNNPNFGEPNTYNQVVNVLFHDEFVFLKKEGLIRYNTMEIKTLNDIFNTK